MGDRRKGSGRTKAFLVDEVHRRHGGLTKKEATEIVDTIFSTVKATLVDGEAVRIRNFGVFEVKRRAGRQGVDPSSGEPLYIPPHKGLHFRPSKRLKKNVDREEEQEEQ
ncbi:MAG: HU family DNA-binding protein [Thermoanaerobaculia bacterium]|nr:HU family DNA-binding protein [Thermoanaerobaculia bacterium]